MRNDLSAYCTHKAKLTLARLPKCLPGRTQKSSSPYLDQEASTDRRIYWQASVYLSKYLTSPIPKPRGSLGHNRRLHDQIPPFFSVLHRPLGLCELQACPIPDVVYPPLLLCAFSSPFHCALQDGFGQTWWTGDMSISLQFVSLYIGQKVFLWSDATAVCVSLQWSGGLPVACWILARTFSLVVWSL